MGDFNPNTQLIGNESPFTSSANYTLDSPNKAVAMRFRPGAGTLANFYVWLANVVGNPGLAIEVVDSLSPAIDQSNIEYPGSDTGAVTTGWQDSSGGALNFGDINDRYNYTAPHNGRNTSSLALGGSLPMSFRGSKAAGAYANKRVLFLRHSAYVINTLTGYPVTISAFNVPITADLNIGSVQYSSPRRTAPLNNVPQWMDPLYDWLFNPATSLPWTVAALENIITTTGGDRFGITPYGNLAALAFWPLAFWLNPFIAVENRHGFFYTKNTPGAGWNKIAMGSTTAELANTWYWAIVSCPYANPGNYATIPILSEADSPETILASGTGEHRKSQTLVLTSPAGIPSSSASPGVVDQPKTMIPLMWDTGGAPVSQSQPYAQVAKTTINRATVANTGQQITSVGGATVVGVRGVFGYETVGVRPDQPLILTLKSGAGAISGAGATLATATLRPEDYADGALAVALFDLGAVPIAGTTQYTVIVSSNASVGKGWTITYGDTRSDLVTAALGAGPSVATVEGASQGGQTDTVVAGGVQFTRFDYQLAIVTAPAGPASLTVTVRQADKGELDAGDTAAPSCTPPRADMFWPATSFGANFGGYKVERRLRGMPVQPWETIATPGAAAIAAGIITPANIEAQFRFFTDAEAGWGVAGSDAELGYDYAVSAFNSNTKLWSQRAFAYGIVIPPTDDTWAATNVRPWLSTPLRVEAQRRGTIEDNLIVDRPAGRDGAIVRTVQGVPTRKIALNWKNAPYLSEAVIRNAKAAGISGQKLALVDCRGDRILGVMGAVSTQHASKSDLDMAANFVDTGPACQVADYNQPAVLVFNGSSQYAAGPVSALINPLTGPFTVLVVAQLPAANGLALSDGDVLGGTNQYFGIRRNGAGNWGFYFKGASATGSVTFTDATIEADNRLHCISADSDGAAQHLYLDGLPKNSGAVAHGSIGNATPLAVGADNNGGAGFLGSGTRAWAYYPSVLTPAQHKAAARYLMGWVGYKMPPGAAEFHDVNDDRCWDGVSATLLDLSGNSLHATAVASPVARGRPWSLKDLDQRW